MNFIFEWRKTIFYERAQRVSEKLSLTRENKIHIFKPPCNFLLLHRQTDCLHKNLEKAGNDVINIFTGEDMEHTLLGSRM